MSLLVIFPFPVHLLSAPTGDIMADFGGFGHLNQSKHFKCLNENVNLYN